MAKHLNSKVVVHHGQVVSLEQWTNRKDGEAFRKVWIVRQKSRFMVTTNFLGSGQPGLNISRSIEAAMFGFEDDFASFVVRLFNSSNLNVREWVDLIGPNYTLEMKG